MKYCVSARLGDAYMAKADEIFINYADIDYILDLIEKFSDKTVIVHVPKDELDIDWTTLRAYSEKIKIVLALEDLVYHMLDAQEYNIPYFWYYPATSFFELRGLLQSGVCAALIAAPLCFDLKKVIDLTNHTIDIRMVPNIAYDAYIPHRDGIEGGYIRPEDVEAYEPYVDVIDFLHTSIRQEKTLFKIYHDEKKWDGNLNLLITNLDFDVDNRGIADDFAEHRMTCGQHCMSRGTCHYCRTAFLLCRTIDKKKSEILKDTN